MPIELISPQPKDAYFWLQVRKQKSTQENNPVGNLSEKKLREQIFESNRDLRFKQSVHRFYIQTAEKEFAGVISLREINWESGVCELGYLIAEKFQNKGIATQAVRLLMQKSFAAGIRKIKATTYVHNVASYKVLEKNGFVLEGTLKNEILIKGKIQDLYSWAAFSDIKEDIETR